MKVLGRIQGKTTKILLGDKEKGRYIINEIDDKGETLNSITLNQEEFERLHMAMSKIEDY